MVFLTTTENVEKEEFVLKKYLETVNQRAFQIIWICIISMVFCQVLKIIILSLKEKKINWRYAITTGGFPSSHSALCMTLVTSLFLFQMHDLGGKIDWSFTVAVVISLIIIHDAMGVRLEASKHAKILNNITDDMPLEQKQKLGFGKRGYLKEMLGHKFFEVVGGLIIGALIGVLGYVILVKF